MEKYEESQRKETGDLNEIATYLEKDDENDIPEDSREKVNPPKIAEGMIPIKYDEEKQNWVITNEEDKEWYDYSVGEKRWANIMLSDGTYKTSEKNYQTDGSTIVKENELGSMFVWIPRYAYSIKKYHTASNLTEGTTQEIFDIKFINGTGTKDFEGKSYEKSYDEGSITVGNPTPMIVHPGFTFGGIELTGIWVAKFEASMERGKESTGSDDVTGKNVTILPNAETWRYISIENCFWNCYNMNGDKNVYGIAKNQVDTHLMKNTEWGLVVYLTASKYGIVPAINDYCTQTNTLYHEFSGGNNYKINTKQSTTGNTTGIYDINGGGWEYVAAYYDNLDQSLQQYGGTTLFNNRQLNTSYAKYWDKYEVGTIEKTVTERDGIYRNYAIWDATYSDEVNGNSKRKSITEEKYKLMKNKLGDAMHEVIGTEYSYYGKTTSNVRTWIKTLKPLDSESGAGFYNDDASLIGNCALPFMLRGGGWFDEIHSGVFALSDIYGSISYYPAFRPVLVA